MDGKRRTKRVKRKTVDDAVDLISELPRGVIDAIMERIPLRDAARMSVLSHKWYDIWISIQKLAFDARFFSNILKNKIHVTSRFNRIVSKVLFQHRGDLLKFHLYIPSLQKCPDVAQWICYLSRTDISDISIENQYKLALKLNSHIFSCGNLEKLKLYNFEISIPQNFEGFKKMTCLELNKTALSEETLKCLIQNCPLLQKLRLTSFTGMRFISINAPNLNHVTVDGTFNSLEVENAANLVSAFFGLQKWVVLSRKASLRVLIEDLASSSKLQKLAFGGHFCKELCKISLLPTPFEKLRNLELSSIHLNKLDDISSIISTIQSCPAIESLSISVSSSKHQTTPMDLPDFVLDQLCYADVRICSGSAMELKLIEFLLKCSPILKKLSITSNGDVKTVFKKRVMGQLIQFTRTSQEAKVICPDLNP